MSEEETIDLIPDELIPIFQKWKEGTLRKLSPEEKELVFDFLVDMREQKKIKQIGMAVGIAPGTLYRAIHDREAPDKESEATVEKQITQLRTKSIKDIVKKNWAELESIITDPKFLSFKQVASERNMPFKAFVLSALEFYDAYVDRISIIDSEIEKLKFTINFLMERTKPYFITKAYLQFVAWLFSLKAQGIYINDEMLNEIRKFVEEMFRTQAELQTREVDEVANYGRGY